MRSFYDYIDGAILGFFLISGFFTKEPLQFSIQTWLENFGTCFKKLFIPFFLFSLVNGFLVWALGKQSLSDGLWLTITLTGSSMQLYFLPYLFYVIVAFFTFVALANQFRLNARIALLFVLAILFGYTEMHRTNASTGNSMQLLPLYGATYIIGFYLARMWHWKKIAFYPLTLLLVCVSTTAGLWDKRFFDLAAMIFLLVAALYLSSFSILSNKTFHGSGGIYLLHTPIVLYAVSVILQESHVMGYFNLIGSISITYAICLTATLIFRRKFNRFAFLLLEH